MYGYNQIFNISFILAADSYKLHHAAESKPEFVQTLALNVPRKGSKATSEIVSAGQTMAARIIADVVITKEAVDEAVIEANQMGYEIDRAKWDFIVNERNGVLPLSVWGIEEGTVVKPNTPVLGIINTVDGYGWLAKYTETVVQRTMWKMTNVATSSRFIYNKIKEAMIKTGSDLSMLPYKLHNFGDRGADGQDAAIMAGIAHAMLFSGSDCTSANSVIKRLYNTSTPFLSSVDATEHSVMCEFSDAANKDDYGAAVMSVERLEEAIARSKRGVGVPVQSVVIDTYDDVRFVDEYIGVRLKDRIIKSGGTLVLRPDSGDPLTKPIEIIQILHKRFGAEKNEAGFWVLPSCVRVIQGDGITQDSIPLILENLIAAGYSVDNMLFGMGGGLTHGAGRDEYSYSMKAVALRDKDGNWTGLLKEPKTDAGKKSLFGLVRPVYNDDGDLVVETFQNAWDYFDDTDGWRCYAADGQIEYLPSFEREVRRRARA